MGDARAMRSSISTLTCGALLAAPLLFTTTACDGKQMALQAPVDSAAPMAMERKMKTASFGSWTAERTKGGAIRTVSVSAGPWGAEAVQQDFDYATRGGASEWTGSCAFDASGQNVAFSQFGENSAFACTLDGAGGEWTLFLARNGSGRQATLDGKLEGGGQSFEVTMTRTTSDGKTPISPLGYHISKDGGAVGAVQLANPTQVWMAEGLDPATQDAVAAATGALVFSYPAVQQTFSSL